ncbi:Lon Peptidase N-Terminal Domain And Ring Finger Protein 2 [Manis pentadactyla]|nr:Lon Peptidase N-Terminal Domain And Ring Finger Protein 2 [Manis pentadactyla]
MSPEPVPPPSPPPVSRRRLGEPSARRLKGEEAFRAGDYEMAAELLLAGLAQPDRGLCLRLGDALARAGRLHEALGAFRGAARLGALRPEELGELAGGLARALGQREGRLQPAKPGEGQSASAAAAPRHLLGCPRCQRLLHKSALRGLGARAAAGAASQRGAERPAGEVLPAEGRVRRLAGQARSLQRQLQPEAALLRCGQALGLAPGGNSILLLRAELYLTMKNYEQVLHDTNAVCQNELLLAKVFVLIGFGDNKWTSRESTSSFWIGKKYGSVEGISLLPCFKS